MSDVLDMLAALSDGAVEVAGVKWKIRAVRSDMIRDLRYHILHVRMPTEEDIVEQQSIATRPEAEQAPARAAIELRRQREAVTPERMADAAAKDEQLVCAGVVAVLKDGAWRDVRIVASDPVGESMWVGALPAPVVAELSRAIWTLSTDGGDAAARIRTFLREP